jgi:hypothetical protein
VDAQWVGGWYRNRISFFGMIKMSIFCKQEEAPLLALLDQHLAYIPVALVERHHKAPVRKFSAPQVPPAIPNLPPRPISLSKRIDRLEGA